MNEREKSSKIYKDDVQSNVDVMKKAELELKLQAAEKETAQLKAEAKKMKEEMKLQKKNEKDN